MIDYLYYKEYKTHSGYGSSNVGKNFNGKRCGYGEGEGATTGVSRGTFSGYGNACTFAFEKGRGYDVEGKTLNLFKVGEYEQNRLLLL